MSEVRSWNHKCYAFVVFVLNYYMKCLVILLFLLSSFLSFGQKVFEGKIVYAYQWDKYESVLKGDSILMITYYAPGKIRTDMLVSNNDVSKDDTYVIGFLDSNIYYVLHPATKKAERILIDTPGLTDLRIISGVTLNDEIEVLGRKCYGVKEVMKYNRSMLDSGAAAAMEVTTYYAKDLYFPYKGVPYFTQSSAINNNNIFLSTKTSYNSGPFGNNEIVLTAVKIEQFKIHDSLFAIPENLSTQTTKMSDILNDTAKRTVTVTEITKEEEEKPEPPPPPPPGKSSKSTKSPAKKPDKQKSGNK